MLLDRLQPLNATTWLGLWHVTEDTETLQTQLLRLRPQHELPVFKAPSRTQEWLAARILVYTLLAELTAAPLHLQRHETGQPYLDDAEIHVSITHSGQWVAALISGSHQVGIDLELIGERIPRLAPRFLNEAELKAADQDSDKLHLYWSAKETLYKVHSRRQLFFREQMLLQDFEKQAGGTFAGRILTEEVDEQYEIQYELTPAYVLTYVLASQGNKDI